MSLSAAKGPPLGRTQFATGPLVHALDGGLAPPGQGDTQQAPQAGEWIAESAECVGPRPRGYSAFTLRHPVCRQQQMDASTYAQSLRRT